MAFEDAAALQVVQVGEVAATGPVPASMTASLTAPRQAAIASAGSSGQRHVLQALGDPNVVLVGHPAHAGAQRPHEVQAASR